MFGSLTWASMASAAPNAFGAALAFPGRRAIALCGGGGFTMLGLGDLLTQVQRKARVVNVICDEEPGDVRDALQAAPAHADGPVVAGETIEHTTSGSCDPALSRSGAAGVLALPPRSW